MWKPFTRLVGQGLASEGPSWAFSRGILQSVFSGKNITAMTDEMSATIAEAVDELAARTKEQPSVDAVTELTRIVHRTVIRVFFGSRISMLDAERLGKAIHIATTSIGARMLFPFVPHSIPLPGDRAFARAVQTVDEIMFPIVREARRQATEDGDVVSLLIRARDADGRSFNDQQVRDDLVGMFVASSETTVTALTWLWAAMDTLPEVSSKLYTEVDQVVGEQQPGREHLDDLVYMKMVLQELLRMYSVGWIVPRMVVDDDVIDGVRIKGGSILVISPYLTHRLESVWDDPHVFDPERFAPESGRDRHRLAYLAFGYGPHACLGSSLFMIESQLIVSAMLRRFRPRLGPEARVEPQVRLTLKPRNRIELVLHPKVKAA
jgi:cytochrome P450